MDGYREYDEYDEDELEEMYCVVFNEEHRAIKVEPTITLIADNIRALRPHEKKEGKIHYDPIGFAWGRTGAERAALTALEELTKEYGAITWKE